MDPCGPGEGEARISLWGCYRSRVPHPLPDPVSHGFGVSGGSSLSGGEKSLTTLAFIFSIQRYIPAPFYAFDEVDMSLDGSNVERISSMITELSPNSQFVIVSLRKPMIEAAQRIMGVTLRPDKSTLVTGVKANG